MIEIPRAPSYLNSTLPQTNMETRIVYPLRRTVIFIGPFLDFHVSFRECGLLGYVTIGYIEPSSHYLGNWSSRVLQAALIWLHVLSALQGL